MSKHQEQTTVESEAIETFRVHEQRYREHGLDFEAELDMMAQNDVKKIISKGLVYPVNGTAQEKWLFLREIHQKSEKEKQIDVIRIKILEKLAAIDKALKSGDRDAYNTAIYSPPSFSAEQLEDMEIGLDEELETYPELRSLIEATRKDIGRLRKLI